MKVKVIRNMEKESIVKKGDILEIIKSFYKYHVIKIDDNSYLIPTEWCEVVENNTRIAEESYYSCYSKCLKCDNCYLKKGFTLCNLLKNHEMKNDICNYFKEKENRTIVVNDLIVDEELKKEDIKINKLMPCETCKHSLYYGHSDVYCGDIIGKCFNYDKYETIEKEIELPNEFYFKYFKDNKEYKAIKRDEEYAIYGVKDLGYCYDYSLDICKKSINDKEWIIIETPTDNDNKIELDEFKKVSKFIALTTTEDFKVFIAKDKIVSVLQYEDKCFITTVAIEGIFTVREKSVDIIKMLEE